MFEEYNEILTTEELAQILRLNERTVIKLVKEGKLPAAKIANQFRFCKYKIAEWLEMQMNQYSDCLLAEMEKGTIEKSIPIHRLLIAKNIKLDLDSKTKEDVLEELVHIESSTEVLKNPKELLKLLKKREQQCSTGLENGIAFPHPRASDHRLVKQILLVIGLSKKGIEFEALDQKPTNIFVMSVIPILSLHLQILSRLSRIFNDQEVTIKILSANTEQEVIDIIKDKELELDKNQ